MLPKKLSEIVVLFQIYGVVTLKSKLSICWTFVALLLSLDTLWIVYSSNFVYLFKVYTVSGQTRALSHLLLFSARLFVFCSSIFNIGKFKRILVGFEEFDTTLLQRFNIEVNTKERVFRLGTKLIVVLALAIIIPLINLAFPRVDRSFWWLTVMTIHMLHAKDISMVFFIDSLNYRLKSLTLASNKGDALEILTLHSKLYTMSKLINESHGAVTLTITQHYFGSLVNLFWFFLIINGLEFVVPITREFFAHS